MGLDDPSAGQLAAVESKGGEGPAPSPGSPLGRALIDRLLLATEGRDLRDIAARTRYHPETVRRYLRRGRLSLRFFAAVCEQFNVSPEWLLWGTGPMRGRNSPPRTPEPPLALTVSIEIKDGSAVVKGVECQRPPRPGPRGLPGREALHEPAPEPKRRGGDSNPR